MISCWFQQAIPNKVVFNDVDGVVLCAADLASGIGAAGLSIDVNDYPFLRLIGWQSVVHFKAFFFRKKTAVWIDKSGDSVVFLTIILFTFLFSARVLLILLGLVNIY